MAIGKFDETKENTDNTEKSRNQILETPEDYEDDFDKKLDQNESKNESSGDKLQESEKYKGEDSEKGRVLDRLRNLLFKKESNEENSESSVSTEKERDNGSEKSESRNSFVADLRKDRPSYEAQAQKAETLEGRDEYLDARKESDEANKNYPDRKSWELTPEKLNEIRDGQQEISQKYRGENDEN